MFSTIDSSDDTKCVRDAIQAAATATDPKRPLASASNKCLCELSIGDVWMTEVTEGEMAVMDRVIQLPIHSTTVALLELLCRHIEGQRSKGTTSRKESKTHPPICPEGVLQSVLEKHLEFHDVCRFY